MSDIIVIDNFFDNFEEIENEFKNLQLYNCEEHSKLDKPTNLYIKWPGKRSVNIDLVKPELFNVFRETFNRKLNDHKVLKINNLVAGVCVHLRLDVDDKNDFIHVDSPESIYTCLVYLNETNLNSGTGFFNEKDEQTIFVPYEKNRLVIFDSSIPHKSVGNFGENIYNGRLTLNCFFKDGDAIQQ